VIVIDHIRPGTTYKTNSAGMAAGCNYSATIHYSHDTGATWDTDQTAPVTSIRWTIPRWFVSGSIIEVKFEVFID